MRILSPAFRSESRRDSREIVETTPARTRYVRSFWSVHEDSPTPSARGSAPAAVTMRRNTSAVIFGGRPERGRGRSPGTPERSNRVSQLVTVGRERPRRRMISATGTCCSERRTASARPRRARGCCWRICRSSSRSAALRARTNRLGVSATHYLSTRRPDRGKRLIGFEAGFWRTLRSGGDRVKRRFARGCRLTQCGRRRTICELWFRILSTSPAGSPHSAT